MVGGQKMECWIYEDMDELKDDLAKIDNGRSHSLYCVVETAGGSLVDLSAFCSKAGGSMIREITRTQDEYGKLVSVALIHK